MVVDNKELYMDYLISSTHLTTCAVLVQGTGRQAWP